MSRGGPQAPLRPVEPSERSCPALGWPEVHGPLLCEAAGPAGSEPSVPPGWVPQAAAEISPRGRAPPALLVHLHAPPSYHSHLRPALLSLTPGAAGGQGILQDSLLRPLPLRASLLLHSRTEKGCGEGGGGAGSQWGGCGVTGVWGHGWRVYRDQRAEGMRGSPVRSYGGEVTGRV